MGLLTIIKNQVIKEETLYLECIIIILMIETIFLIQLTGALAE
jgi:hypothetical protein